MSKNRIFTIVSSPAQASPDGSGASSAWEMSQILGEAGVNKVVRSASGQQRRLLIQKELGPSLYRCEERVKARAEGRNVNTEYPLLSPTSFVDHGLSLLGQVRAFNVRLRQRQRQRQPQKLSRSSHEALTTTSIASHFQSTDTFLQIPAPFQLLPPTSHSRPLEKNSPQKQTLDRHYNRIACVKGKARSTLD